MEGLILGLGLFIYIIFIGILLIPIIFFIWASIRAGFLKTLGISILFNVCFFILAIIFTEKSGEFLVFSIFGTIIYCIILIILIIKAPVVKYVEVREIREIREVRVNDEDKKNISADSEIKKD